MHHRRAFTLTDLLALMAAGVVLAALLFGGHGCAIGRIRSMSMRMMCQSNLHTIATAMQDYATRNNGAFPVAGAADPAASVHGFKGSALAGATAVAPTDPAMVNNVTASLWVLVRSGSTYPPTYVCPEAEDVSGSSHAWVTATTDWDFGRRRDLSYSPLNMYHPGNFRIGPGRAPVGRWTTAASHDTAVLADNNNADGPGVHTLSHGAAQADVERLENSTNHDRAGQHVAFADGSVVFQTDPFVGRSSENVYAMAVSGGEHPPTLANDAGDFGADYTLDDSALIPLNGNNGVSLSGLPGALAAGSTNASLLVKLLPGLLFVLIVVVAAVLIRLAKGKPDPERAAQLRRG